MPFTCFRCIDSGLFDSARTSSLTHGWWNDTHWEYSDQRCRSGDDLFSTIKSYPNSESAYLHTCFGQMPQQFLVYDFGEPVTLTRYSWSSSNGECPSSWTVHGTNEYPDVDTVLVLVDTERGHVCQSLEEIIRFEVDRAHGEYQYYVWKISESDDGNGDQASNDDNSNDGYVWGTILFYTSQGNIP